MLISNHFFMTKASLFAGGELPTLRAEYAALSAGVKVGSFFFAPRSAKAGIVVRMRPLGKGSGWGTLATSGEATIIG
jgi:hypothetical protein